MGSYVFLYSIRRRVSNLWFREESGGVVGISSPFTSCTYSHNNRMWGGECILIGHSCQYQTLMPTCSVMLHWPSSSHGCIDLVTTTTVAHEPGHAFGYVSTALGMRTVETKTVPSSYVDNVVQGKCIVTEAIHGQTSFPSTMMYMVGEKPTSVVGRVSRSKVQPWQSLPVALCDGLDLRIPMVRASETSWARVASMVSLPGPRC